MALLAACGGDTDRLTGATYRTRASALCEAAASRNDAALEPAIDRLLGALGYEPYSDRELQSFYGDLAPAVGESTTIFEELFARLRGLRPPREQEAEYAALWDALEERQRAAVSRVERAAEDAKEARALWDLEDGPFDSLRPRAARLGVERCILS